MGNCIYNLISDIVLRDQMVDSFKIRDLDQKLLYLEDGASLYYEEKENDRIYGYDAITLEILSSLDIFDYFGNRGKDLFISLGCGKSYLEKKIFETILKEDTIVDYCGVDSSRYMLDMSVKTLEDIDINKRYLLADFFSSDFKSEIHRLSGEYDNRIYTIFNNTFGNLNQTRILNNLKNLLKRGDKLWIDVRMRGGKSISDDLILFNKYRESLSTPTRKRFFDNIFNRFGIDKDDYSYYISTNNDNVVGALVFDFMVKFKKKISCNVYGDQIIILPDEEMKITHIYTYDSLALVDIFGQYGFELKHMFNDDSRGHFIFEKM